MTHHLATFIAPEGTTLPALDASVAIEAHGARVLREDWIERGVAYDIHFEGGDGDELAFILSRLAARDGVDCIVQPGPRREKKLLISDMDSTIIAQECIDEIADAIGIGKKIAAITARAMNGELEFESALRERVALLAGTPEATLREVLERRITLMQGAATLIATLRAHGVTCVLVSGGFTFFTSAVRERAGFDADEANGLEIVDGKLTGRVIEPILGKQAKREALRRHAHALGITLSKTIAIGDGANDVPMLQAAGLGVAYHAKPSVESEVAARIRHNDLTALLYVLGIPRDEWVVRE